MSPLCLPDHQPGVAAPAAPASRQLAQSSGLGSNSRKVTPRKGSTICRGASFAPTDEDVASSTRAASGVSSSSIRRAARAEAEAARALPPRTLGSAHSSSANMRREPSRYRSGPGKVLMSLASSRAVGGLSGKCHVRSASPATSSADVCSTSISAGSATPWLTARAAGAAALGARWYLAKKETLL